MADPSIGAPRALDAGSLGFGEHDADYAAARPDGKTRALQGGTDHSPYTAVDTNDLEHYADMVDTTVTPLFERAQNELDGIPAMAPGHFPHADVYGQRIMKMKDEYAAKVAELARVTHAMSGSMRAAGRSYANAEQANAMSYRDIDGLPQDGAGATSPDSSGAPSSSAPPAGLPPAGPPPAPAPAGDNPSGSSADNPADPHNWPVEPSAGPKDMPGGVDQGGA